MEAVRRRTELAVRQAARKQRILTEKYRQRDKRTHLEETFIARREELDAGIAARTRQREDKALGSLRPWREQVGLKQHPTGQANVDWGTFSLQRTRKPRLPENEQLLLRDCLLRKGDRVCVVRGREGIKGRIGTIKEVLCESGFVTVQGVNMIDVEVPDYARNPGEDPIRSVEDPIPYKDLHLIHPLPHPTKTAPFTRLQRQKDRKTGKMIEKTITRQFPVGVDTIIDPKDMMLLYAKSDETLPVNEEQNAYRYETDGHDDSFSVAHTSHAYYFPSMNTRKGPRYRYIMPQRLRIPWPATPERTRQDLEEDTLGAMVEARTWVPTLLRPPMPEGVINELRSPYSKYRSRHEPEYIAKKEAEDAAKEEVERKKLEMRGRSARNLARRRAPSAAATQRNKVKEVEDVWVTRKRAVGRKGVDPVMAVDSKVLTALGEHMARKRGLVGSGAKGSGIPPPPPSSSGQQPSVS